MKKILSLSLLAIALLFTSCEKEASYLDINALPSQVKIEGFVKYNPYKVSNKTLEDDWQDKEEASVYLNVSMSNYIDTLQTSKRYETITDKNGHYSFTIPVKTGESLKATISTTFTEDSYASISSNYILVTTLFQKSEDIEVYDGQTLEHNILTEISGYPEDSDL